MKSYVFFFNNAEFLLIILSFASHKKHVTKELPYHETTKIFFISDFKQQITQSKTIKAIPQRKPVSEIAHETFDCDKPTVNMERLARREKKKKM